MKEYQSGIHDWMASSSLEDFKKLSERGIDWSYEGKKHKRTPTGMVNLNVKKRKCEGP